MMSGISGPRMFVRNEMAKKDQEDEQDDPWAGVDSSDLSSPSFHDVFISTFLPWGRTGWSHER